jgi:hypothetical protein
MCETRVHLEQNLQALMANPGEEEAEKYGESVRILAQSWSKTEEVIKAAEKVQAEGVLPGDLIQSTKPAIEFANINCAVLLELSTLKTALIKAKKKMALMGEGEIMMNLHSVLERALQKLKSGAEALKKGLMSGPEIIHILVDARKNLVKDCEGFIASPKEKTWKIYVRLQALVTSWKMVKREIVAAVEKLNAKVSNKYVVGAVFALEFARLLRGAVMELAKIVKVLQAVKQQVSVMEGGKEGAKSVEAALENAQKELKQIRTALMEASVERIIEQAELEQLASEALEFPVQFDLDIRLCSIMEARKRLEQDLVGFMSDPCEEEMKKCKESTRNLTEAWHRTNVDAAAAALQERVDEGDIIGSAQSAMEFVKFTRAILVELRTLMAMLRKMKKRVAQSGEQTLSKVLQSTLKKALQTLRVGAQALKKRLLADPEAIRVLVGARKGLVEACNTFVTSSGEEEWKLFATRLRMLVGSWEVVRREIMTAEEGLRGKVRGKDLAGGMNSTIVLARLLRGAISELLELTKVLRGLKEHVVSMEEGIEAMAQAALGKAHEELKGLRTALLSAEHIFEGAELQQLKAEAAVDEGAALLDFADMMLSGASIIPGFGSVCNVLKGAVGAGREVHELASDALELTESMIEIGIQMIELQRLAKRMQHETKQELGVQMDKITSLVEDMTEAIKHFGKKGFFGKMFVVTRVSKRLAFLERRKERIMKAIEHLLQRVSINLQLDAKEHRYLVEEAIWSKIREHLDENGQTHVETDVAKVLEELEVGGDVGVNTDVSHAAADILRMPNALKQVAERAGLSEDVLQQGMMILAEMKEEHAHTRKEIKHEMKEEHAHTREMIKHEMKEEHAHTREVIKHEMKEEHAHAREVIKHEMKEEHAHAREVIKHEMKEEHAHTREEILRQLFILAASGESKSGAGKSRSQQNRIDRMATEEIETLAQQWKYLLRHDEAQLLKDGREHYRLQNFDKALECFQRVVQAEATGERIAPRDLKQAKRLSMFALIQSGLVLLRTQSFEVAAEHFIQALQFREGSDKRMEMLRAYHACCLYEAGKQTFSSCEWSRAEKLFEAAVETHALPSVEYTAKAESLQEKCVEARKRLKKAAQLKGKTAELGDAIRESEAFSLYVQGKDHLRRGAPKLARQYFRDAQALATLPCNVDSRIDTHLDQIRACLKSDGIAASRQTSTCIFDHQSQLLLPARSQGAFGTNSLRLGSPTSQILGTKELGISKEMVAVIKMEFPHGTLERTKLVAKLSADLRQALNIIYGTIKFGRLREGGGSTIASFRVLQHREHEESVGVLEHEYRREVEDEESRLYLKNRSVTRLIDAPRTLELMHQIASTEAANTETMTATRGHYTVGETIMLLDIECTLNKRLGEGASGTVFEVTFNVAGKSFSTSALKVISAKDGFKQLCQETSIMLTLNWPRPHPNVLVVDFVWYNQQLDELLFLTELVDGGNLQEWINDEQLYAGSMQKQQNRLVSIAHQIASAVQHLHNHGILHQDIKPENIVMTKEGKPVLADFGASRKGSCSGQGRVDAKVAGVTLAFASPNHIRAFEEAQTRTRTNAEHVSSASVTHLDDIWSLATTILDTFAKCGWQGGQSVEDIVLNMQHGVASLEGIPMQVEMPLAMEELLCQCFLAHTVSNSDLTMDSVVEKLDRMDSSTHILAARNTNPINGQRCSVVHSNLGLALQHRGLHDDAQVQFQRVMEIGGGHTQILEIRARNAAGEGLEKCEKEARQQFVAKMWKPVQAKLQQVLGADHPVGCRIKVQEDGLIVVGIIRASLWDQMMQVALLTDVGFLQQLRDVVLSGDFEQGFYISQGQELFSIMVDMSRFLDMYERCMLMLTTMTPHQQKKYHTCIQHNKAILTEDVRLEGPAGSGKTFVGLCLVERTLNVDEQTCVLLVARTEALAYSLAKCIWMRNVDANMLTRLHVLCGAALARFMLRVTDEGLLLMEPVGERVETQYKLVAVDEAHTLDHNLAATQIQRYTNESIAVVPRLLISDVSQSEEFTDSWCNVLLARKGNRNRIKPKRAVLNQVVRCSRNIIDGAKDFQTNNAKSTECHHNALGPPLKSFLFEKNGRHQDQVYAEKVFEALDFLHSKYPGLDLNNRVGIVTPTDEFTQRLECSLKERLRKRQQQQHQPQREFSGSNQPLSFVRAAEASRRVVAVRSDGTEWIVLDTVEAFNGLERLIIIAVCLDSPLVKEGLQTRSILYRALTRAQMMAIVVNEHLQGGWLEYLTFLKFEDNMQLDSKDERRAQHVSGKAHEMLSKDARGLLLQVEQEKQLLQQVESNLEAEQEEKLLQLLGQEVVRLRSAVRQQMELQPGGEEIYLMRQKLDDKVKEQTLLHQRLEKEKRGIRKVTRSQREQLKMKSKEMKLLQQSREEEEQEEDDDEEEQEQEEEQEEQEEENIYNTDILTTVWDNSSSVNLTTRSFSEVYANGFMPLTSKVVERKKRERAQAAEVVRAARRTATEESRKAAEQAEEAKREENARERWATALAERREENARKERRAEEAKEEAEEAKREENARREAEEVKEKIRSRDVIKQMQPWRRSRGSHSFGSGSGGSGSTS